jgi:hypothetical protein
LALALLQAFDQVQPLKVEVFIPDIILKFFCAMCDHLAATQAVQQTRHLIEGLCDLMKTRVATMGKHCLYLLSGLVQLVEKSPHLGLCCYILSVQRKRIEDKDLLLMSREKAMILV